MKKTFVILFIVLSFVYIFSNDFMRLELLTYWSDNNIEYVVTDVGATINVTKNGMIKAVIPKDSEYIVFMFGFEAAGEDYEDFKKTKRLPYMIDVREGILKYLSDIKTYLSAFGKHPSPMSKIIGHRYLTIKTHSGEEYIYFKIH